MVDSEAVFLGEESKFWWDKSVCERILIWPDFPHGRRKYLIKGLPSCTDLRLVVTFFLVANKTIVNYECNSLAQSN